MFVADLCFLDEKLSSQHHLIFMHKGQISAVAWAIDGAGRWSLSCHFGNMSLFYQAELQFQWKEVVFQDFKGADGHLSRLEVEMLLLPSLLSQNKFVYICMCVGRSYYSILLHKWPRCEMKTAIEGVREGERDVKYRGRVID